MEARNILCTKIDDIEKLKAGDMLVMSKLIWPVHMLPLLVIPVACVPSLDKLAVSFEYLRGIADFIKDFLV